MSDIKEKVIKRIPKQPELILAAIRRFNLTDKVNLRDQINEAIQEEVETMKQAALQAEKIAGGKQ